MVVYNIGYAVESEDMSVKSIVAEPKLMQCADRGIPVRQSRGKVEPPMKKPRLIRNHCLMSEPTPYSYNLLPLPMQKIKFSSSRRIMNS